MRLPSVSIGSAIYPLDGHGTEQLLNVADQRMYADKATHRGGVPVRVNVAAP